MQQEMRCAVTRKHVPLFFLRSTSGLRCLRRRVCLKLPVMLMLHCVCLQNLEANRSRRLEGFKEVHCMNQKMT